MDEQDIETCNCSTDFDYSDPGFWIEAKPEQLPCRFCALGMMMDMSMAILEMRMRFAGDPLFDLDAMPTQEHQETKDPEGKLIQFPFPNLKEA